MLQMVRFSLLHGRGAKTDGGRSAFTPAPLTAAEISSIRQPRLRQQPWRSVRGVLECDAIDEMAGHGVQVPRGLARSVRQPREHRRGRRAVPRPLP